MSNSNTDSSNDNKKLYCILSYVGLWLVGLLVPERDDPKLKFHVGQGIILSIVFAGVCTIIVIALLIIRIVFFGGYGGYLGYAAYFSYSYYLISIILWLVFISGPIALMIVGILNAVNDKENKLPFIGDFAFYK